MDCSEVGIKEEVDDIGVEVDTMEDEIVTAGVATMTELLDVATDGAIRDEVDGEED